MTFDLIIIGTGLAGYTLAKSFRAINQSATILMISCDDGCFYSKPLLSTGFAKNKSSSELASFSAQQMADKHDLSIYPHTQVISIDKDARSLQLSSKTKGEVELHYAQALIMATGAEPIHINLPTPLEGRTFSINDLNDYGRFREQLKDRSKVAIIGSGLVGTEYANDLSLADHSVSVISLDQTPLQLLLPPPLGTTVQQQLCDQGINWHLNTTIKDAKLKEHNQLTLELTNGDQLDCDIVLSAVGLKPRDQLACDAKLATNRGIVVNKQLQTSDPHIFALGDCARIDGVNLMYVSILTLSAKALAQTLNGEPTTLVMPASPVMVKTPSCPVVANPPVDENNGNWQFEGEAPNLKACFFDHNNQLTGFALTGKQVMQRMKLAKQLPAIL